jgi:hypothetical protein
VEGSPAAPTVKESRPIGRSRKGSGKVMSPREKNWCQSCGYSWFPRGHALAATCPKCRSPATELESARKERLKCRACNGTGKCSCGGSGWRPVRGIVAAEGCECNPKGACRSCGGSGLQDDWGETEWGKVNQKLLSRQWKSVRPLLPSPALTQNVPRNVTAIPKGCASKLLTKPMCYSTGP